MDVTSLVSLPSYARDRNATGAGGTPGEAQAPGDTGGRRDALELDLTFGVVPSSMLVGAAQGVASQAPVSIAGQSFRELAA